VPDWLAVLTIVLCLGGSAAFALFLNMGRYGGRTFRTGADEALREVAELLRGEFRPREQMWSVHKSMRMFGAAAGTRPGFAYEVSRYPFNVENGGGAPYVALRPDAGTPVLPESGIEAANAEPALEKALGRRIARRLRPDAVGPLLELVGESAQIYRYRDTLVVLAPEALWPEKTEITPVQLVEWVERVLAIGERLYPRR
jgi:hypothetical protein